MFNVENIISLFTLTTLEVVLGIDNLIFIALLLVNIPINHRKFIFSLGLICAFTFRILFLASLYDLTKLNKEFHFLNFSINIKDLVFLTGGLFLIIKSLSELFKLRHPSDHKEVNTSKSYAGLIIQIIFIDIVFSFDSILVAIAIVKDLYIVVTAILISMIIMYLFRDFTIDIIKKYPGIKTIAICFIIFLGGTLVLKAFNIEISKNYLYAILVFSTIVEFINIRLNLRK